MNIVEFYQEMGVEYANVLRRLGSEALIKKYLFKFASDKSFLELQDNITAHNFSEAFRAAHTLKGISLNLELKPITVLAIELTELLRNGGNGKEEEIGRALREFSQSYGDIIKKIAVLR